MNALEDNIIMDKIVIKDSNEKDMVKLFIETHKIASTLSINLDKEKLLKRATLLYH